MTRIRRSQSTSDSDQVRFDRDKALASWKQKLATMTARGFANPPFASLIASPASHDDPGRIS